MLETPAPSSTDSCFRKGIEGNRKEWNKWEKLREMDNKSQHNQVITCCFITQVLHTKCRAVVSYAVR